MQRDYKSFLTDILRAINKIERFMENKNYDDFLRDELLQDGVIRNLEIIGEAVKHLPPEFRAKYSQIEWKKIAGLRDILIHAYFGIDLEIVWDVVKNKIPSLKQKVEKICNNLRKE